MVEGQKGLNVLPVHYRFVCPLPVRDTIFPVPINPKPTKTNLRL